MVQKQTCILVRWVMSKLIHIVPAVFMAFGFNPVLASQEALKALLMNGQVAMATLPDCEPFQTEQQSTLGPGILSQDIASALAGMEGKPVSIASSCEATSDSSSQCKVVFSVAQGEVEWSRIYQFDTVPNSSNAPQLKNLRCFNLP